MRTVVVYESIYGNTKGIAEGIAEGLHHGDQAEVEVLPVDRVGARGLEGVDLLVVGGPTHMHGMTSSMSRKLAVKAAEDEGLEVEPGAAEGLGLRTWLRDQAGDGMRAAAFDSPCGRLAHAHGNGGARDRQAAAPPRLRDGR